MLLGKTNWRTDICPAWESIGISTDSQEILVKGFEDKFHILSASDGKLIKSINADYGTDTSPASPVEVNGNILFGTKNGTVYCINNKYEIKPVIFCGTARITGIVPVSGNALIVTNMDGKIISFKLKGM